MDSSSSLLIDESRMKVVSHSFQAIYVYTEQPNFFRDSKDVFIIIGKRFRI